MSNKIDTQSLQTQSGQAVLSKGQLVDNLHSQTHFFIIHHVSAHVLNNVTLNAEPHETEREREREKIL